MELRLSPYCENNLFSVDRVNEICWHCNVCFVVEYNKGVRFVGSSCYRLSVSDLVRFGNNLFVATEQRRRR